MRRAKKEKKMENAVAQKLRRVLRGRNCLRGHPIMRIKTKKKDAPGINNMNINVTLLRTIRKGAGKVEIKIQLS